MAVSLRQPFHDRWFKSQKHRWDTYDNGMIHMNEGARREGGQELERKTKTVSRETGEKAGKSAACDLHLFAC